MLTVRNILSADELAELLRGFESGVFDDGARTAVDAGRQVKNNLQMAPSPERYRLGRIVSDALARHRLFMQYAIPRRIRPPSFSRYEVGMEYGDHIDAPIMGQLKDNSLRTDLSVTLFLSEPASYDGGELSIQSPYGTRVVKLPPGQAVIYPSQSVHSVSPVTRGQRLAAITRVESHVKREDQRQLLFDLGRLISETPALRDDQSVYTRATNVHARLVQMWAEN
ncbi:MAG: Fe2+-dependent dioxygenase [Alphaproteobacteria bacterium]|nr:Fe2+-dependent dioxygenase [Alphaproteobacteria bacterium]